MLEEILRQDMETIETNHQIDEDIEETMACGIGGAKSCSGSGTCGTKIESFAQA